MKEIIEITKSLSLEDKNKLILNLVDDFTYEDKIKLIFKIIPQSNFHNYKWREKIQLEILGIVDNRGDKLHGPDSNTHSLKSGKISINNRGKYRISNSTTIGTFGRIDKEMTYDKKDTLCTLFNDNGEVILSIILKYDNNFENMYINEQELKRETMKNNKQTRDSLSINFNLINKYRINYEVKFKNDDVILPL